MTNDAGLYNIKTYGAVGNGQVKEHAAIQAAIDACHAAGGGRVVVPPGRYLTGTIWLKSHVDLHLCHGATLVGSPDREDYNADDAMPHNRVFPSENVTGAHLLIAYEQENIALSGSGTIDGNSGAFFGEILEGRVASYRFKTGCATILSWRPGQMIYFFRCRGVQARDLSLLHAPYWTFFLLGCEDVQIRGLRIENPPSTQNGDGIDIDCCRNVTVSDCIVRTGDDSLTLRAGTRSLGDENGVCENVVVSNCVFSSPTCGIRVGVGEGAIRHCSFNQITVRDARTAVNVNSKYGVGEGHGVRIEEVVFSNFLIDVSMAMTITSGPGAKPPGGISDLVFVNWKGCVSAGSQWAGSPSSPIRRLTLRGIDLEVRGGTENLEFVEALPRELSKLGYHGNAGLPALPCAWYGVEVEDLTLDNVRLRWKAISPVWQAGLILERCREVEIRRARWRQPKETGGAAICCREVKEIALLEHLIEPGTDRFLEADPATTFRGPCRG